MLFRKNPPADFPPPPWRPGSRQRSWASLSWLTLVTALALLTLPFFTDGGLATYFKLRRDRDALRQEVQQLHAEADSLAQQIDQLEQDPAALERIARENFNMRKPGEEVLLLVKPAAPSPAP